jgi:iron complex outermembrane receptor protein
MTLARIILGALTQTAESSKRARRPNDVRREFPLSMTVALCVMASAVPAQTASGGPPATAPAATETAAQPGGLEEIVVTATRRETRLQDTPISMSVLTSADIDRNRLVTMTDVAQQIPSIVYIPDSGSETYLIIRGAATIDDSTGTDQGVSMFVDDVVRVSVADLQPELFDMDRVEVLKGPQGTLFGRNAIGGIVSLYTKNPTFQPESGAEVTYGEHNLAEVRAMFNAPIVADTLAARLVVSRHSNDGYIDDITTHNAAGNQDTWAVRAKLLFTPSNDIRLVGGFDYLSKIGTYAKWLIGNFQPSLDPGLTFNPMQTAQGVPSRFSQRIWGLTARLDWTTAVGELTSVSGYRHLFAHDESVLLGDPLVDSVLKTTSYDSQITEEVRLASPTNQPLTWVTGLYYLHSNRSRPFDVPIDVLPGSFLSLITGVPPSQVLYHLDQDTRTVSYAAFADGTYAITDKVKLNLGGRYTKEQKSGHSFVNLSGIVVGPAISGDYSHSWSAFTPKVSLTYQPSQALMAYATVSRGFQSGGFNVQGATDAALRVPFNSEYVMNYEAGFKYAALDHRLQANVSAFVDRFTDLQVIEYDSANLTFTTTNAGKADVNGIESDLTAAITDRLTVGVKYDYLRTKFTDYVIDNGPGMPPTVNTGHKVPFAAPQRVSASAELHFNLPELRGRVAFGGDYTYRSPIEIAVANDTPQDVRTRTAWRGLINVHASWASDNGRWEVALWGKNVTNIHFLSLAANQSIFVLSPTEANDPTLHIFEGTLSVPSWYGVTVRFKI